jgi:hypothetical protein
LTVNPGTTREAPDTITVTLPTSTIRRVVVYFRAGCLWLVEVAVYHNEFQIIPIDPESSISGDDWPFDCPLEYPLEDGANRITVAGWSAATIYSHDIDVYLYLDVAKEVDMQALLRSLFFGSSVPIVE